jgi:hypothetical protein
MCTISVESDTNENQPENYRSVHDAFAFLSPLAPVSLELAPPSIRLLIQSTQASLGDFSPLREYASYVIQFGHVPISVAVELLFSLILRLLSIYLQAIDWMKVLEL